MPEPSHRHHALDRLFQLRVLIEPAAVRVGEEDAGRDCVHGDTVGRPIGGDGTRKRRERSLSRLVATSRDAAVGDHARDRRNIHNPARQPFDHFPADDLRANKCARDVEVELRPPCVARHFFGWHIESPAANVVHEDVDRSELVDGTPGRLLGLLRHRHVRSKRRHVRAEPCERPRHVIKRRAFAPDEHKVGTRLRKSQRDLLAQTPTAARDHRPPPRQRERIQDRAHRQASVVDVPPRSLAQGACRALRRAVWVVAAINGYVLETIWLPAVAAAWPRRARARGCLPRLRSITAKEPR